MALSLVSLALGEVALGDVQKVGFDHLLEEKAACVIQRAFRAWKERQLAKLEPMFAELARKGRWENTEVHYIHLFWGRLHLVKWDYVNEDFDKDFIHHYVEYWWIGGVLHFFWDYDWRIYEDIKGKSYIVDTIAKWL